MSRSLRSVPVLSFALALLFAIPLAIAAPFPAPGEQSTYPDKPSGLKKLIQDMMKAVKDGDQAALMSYSQSLLLPDPDDWFSHAFGERFGSIMARNYKQETPLIPKMLEKALSNASRDKMTVIDVRRFERTCDGDADDQEYPILALRQQPQPFYEVRLTKNTYYMTLELFAYVDGGFRYGESCCASDEHDDNCPSSRRRPFRWRR